VRCDVLFCASLPSSHHPLPHVCTCLYQCVCVIKRRERSTPTYTHHTHTHTYTKSQTHAHAQLRTNSSNTHSTHRTHNTTPLTNTMTCTTRCRCLHSPSFTHSRSQSLSRTLTPRRLQLVCFACMSSTILPLQLHIVHGRATSVSRPKHESLRLLGQEKVLWGRVEACGHQRHRVREAHAKLASHRVTTQQYLCVLEVWREFCVHSCVLRNERVCTVGMRR
jgi:hypothetical protein